MPVGLLSRIPIGLTIVIHLQLTITLFTLFGYCLKYIQIQMLRKRQFTETENVVVSKFPDPLVDTWLNENNKRKHKRIIMKSSAKCSLPSRVPSDNRGSFHNTVPHLRERNLLKI